MNHTLTTASRSALGTASSFAATQAAWRFYAHEDTTLTRLAEPLLASSLDGVETYCKEYALVVHDWSILNYNRHESKTDRKMLRRSNIQGYELQTSLVLSDNNGLPLGVLAQNLTSQNGVLSSYQAEGLQPELEHLQELAQRVQWLEQQPGSKPMVHIVDREGDGVEWLRACKNSLWLIRCRQRSTVDYNGKAYKIQYLAAQLAAQPLARQVQYKGKTAYQAIAACEVTVPVPPSLNANAPSSKASQ